METKKVKSVNALSMAQLEKVFGGRALDTDDCSRTSQTQCPGCVSGDDSIDCTSESASGGTTTDTEIQ